MKKIKTRTKARQKIFELIFSFEFDKESSYYEFKKLVSRDDIESDIKNFISRIYNGTIENISKIDEIINEYSKNRKIERISKTALSNLRVAIYEIIYDRSIPNSICVNEAVEITKNYSTIEEAYYVNAILFSIEESFKS